MRASSGSFARSKTGVVCQRAVANQTARSPITASSQRGRAPGRIDQRRQIGSAGRRPITEVTRLTSTARISGSRTWKRAK